MLAAIQRAEQAEAQKPTRAVLARATTLARQNNHVAALAALEYAQRLAPSSTAITFAIGQLRLILGDPRASEALELVASRTDWRAAWTNLILARMAEHNAAQAAADLHETLSRNAPADERRFRDLAETVARATGARGWCGLDNSGRLTIGGDVVAIDDIDVRLDGKAAATEACEASSVESYRRLQLADGWQSHASLTVRHKRLHLIGSPIQIQKIIRSEGFVRAEKGGLRGWCWLPGERETAPTVTVASRANPDKRLKVRAVAPETGPGSFPDLAEPRRFTVSQADIAALGGYVDVLGPHGRPLYGSPINPLAEIVSATAAARTIARRFPAVGVPEPSDPAANEISIPADIVGLPPTHALPAGPRPVLVVVPVYRGLKVTMECIDSVLAARGPYESLLVVVDASPEQQLVDALKARASPHTFALDLRPVNKGFPATANVGMRAAAAAGADVILLNSDTLVPKRWMEALKSAVYSVNDIGTATPLSNAATIFSYPDVEKVNPIPDLEETAQFARLAHRSNGDALVEVPTGHGFCLYIRNECLTDTGLLREDLFAQGYAEENDFCLRARHLGWRHVAVPGAFVGHAEGQSFAGAKVHLTERNLGILNRLHPGYDKLIMDWLKQAPLAPFRRAMDIAHLHATQGKQPAVLLVTHDRAGGVLRHIKERTVLHARKRRRGMILRPVKLHGKRGCHITGPEEGSYPNLIFMMPREAPALADFLASCRIELIEIHHFVGHDQSVFKLLTGLDIPYDVVIHDYAWFCPRITLTRKNSTYCGEPDISECTACVADYGQNIDEVISPAALHARSRRLLKKANRIVAPSPDAGRRISRRFGVEVESGVWEDDNGPLALTPVPPLSEGKRRVCLAGAIGYEKGYTMILECARIVAREKLPIEFSIVGFTRDDPPLIDTGCVHITGRYEEKEAVSLIRAQKADFAFLSALWPETWSYVLSQFWEAGLPVLAFDIGAPAERIKRRAGGMVIPLNLPARRLLDTFLSFTASPEI
jgi:GT2 family glycosyltransferase